MVLRLTEYPDRETASEEAAALCADTLAQAIAANGAASLMVSGGSTPTRMFERLAEVDIAWRRVTVGLVDERWVAPDDPDSNERLVRRHLLKGHAADTAFLPMWTGEATPEAAQASCEAAYAPHCRPTSFVVLGMGLDGHTASWFPGLPDLADIVSPVQARCVAAVRAPGAAVPERMTLTGAAVLNAQAALLLVFGAEKRSMLEGAVRADPARCPIRFALDGLGDRLSIFWAP